MIYSDYYSYVFIFELEKLEKPCHVGSYVSRHVKLQALNANSCNPTDLRVIQASKRTCPASTS